MANNISSPIPEKTIERLSEYRRTLLKCHAQGITHIFFHPDYTVGTGVTPVQLSHADFTADREFHPALKTFLFRFSYYIPKCVICNCFLSVL